MFCIQSYICFAIDCLTKHYFLKGFLDSVYEFPRQIVRAARKATFKFLAIP